MAVSDWLRPPRHLVVLFLGIALTLMAALAWLGWRLFQQDRALERQRVQVRLEHAADVVASELTSRLGTIEDRLAELSTVAPSDLPDSLNRFVAQFSQDALLLELDDDALAAYPSGRLLYYPVTMSAAEPDPGVFTRGEALEFWQRDLAGAARVYRSLAQSADSTVRAGALLRLARTERESGQEEEALETYQALAALGRTRVGGLPAEFVARYASLAVLEGLSRVDTLRQRAEVLQTDLHAGRWLLTRPQYEFYAGEVCRWIDCEQDTDAAASAKLALAAGPSGCGTGVMYSKETAMS